MYGGVIIKTTLILKEKGFVEVDFAVLYTM